MNRLSLFLIAMVLLSQTTITKAAAPRFDAGYLGISSERLSKEKARVLKFENPYGHYVTKIWPNTPAEKAGLQIFDYIYGIDQKQTERYVDLDDLLKYKEPGDEVVVHFVRQQQKKSVKVLLEHRSNTIYISTDHQQKAFLGVTEECDCPENEIGLTVGVIYNSTAQELGLKDGDILKAINGFPIYDWGDIVTAVSNMEPGAVVEVSYSRAGRNMQAKGVIKSKKASTSIERARQAPPGFLGIYATAVSKDKARKLGFQNAYGSFVSGVIPGTAAAEIGLQPFDYLYGVDEYRVGEDQKLTQILAKYRAGDKARLHFIRKGTALAKTVALGVRKEEITTIQTNKCEEPFLGVRHDYSTFSEKGVSVTIIKNSTAEEMGMQNGDVILRINDYTIIDWTDISIAIDNCKVGEQVKVSFLRNSRQLQSSRPIKSHCKTIEKNKD